MKILITGVSGFIGRHAARHFANLGHNVYGVSRSAPENAPCEVLVEYFSGSIPQTNCLKFIGRVQPDVILHAAGRAAPVLSLDDPMSDYEDNTNAVIHILNHLRTSNPLCHFILLSSAAVYGQPSVLPVTDKMTLHPLSPYGYHKWQAELLCREYAEIYGIRSTSLRIFSAYGPGLRRQVIYDMVNRAVRTNRVTVRGTGEETRDFIHVTDVCRACEVVLVPRSSHTSLNVASGEETRIKDIAAQVAESLRLSEMPFFSGKTDEGSPTRWKADITPLSSLGFSPCVAFETGLSETIQWCLAEFSYRSAF